MFRNRRAQASLALAAAALIAAALPSAAAAAPQKAAGSAGIARPAASPSPSPSPSGPASSNPSDINVTFGVGPATKGGAIDRRTSFSFLQPRLGVANDYVTVVNLSSRPITLNLYPADALNQADGTLGLQPRYAKRTDLASWITLKTPTGKAFVVVPGRSNVLVPFTVRVPAKAYVGDHLAGIVASVVAKGQTPGDLTTAVAFEQRVGVRVGMRVAGQLKPELTIESLSATYVGTLNPVSPGRATVSYTVRNTGNIRLGGRQSVRVHGLFGPAAEAVGLADIPLLLPGGSAQVTVDVPDVWPLVWLTADVTVVPLGAAGDANPPIGDVTASVSFWGIPWVLLGIILLILLLGLWWLRHRRAVPPPVPGRRERAREADLVAAGTSAAGEKAGS